MNVFGSKMSFAAAVCGVVDAANGNLWLTAAGGPSPLIVRNSGEIDKVALRACRWASWKRGVQRARPAPGQRGRHADLLDGVRDSRLVREDAGRRRVDRPAAGAGLPAHASSIPALEERLLKFSNAIRMPDDVALIEARYVGGD